MSAESPKALAALIIDDDPLVVRLFSRFFTRAGFRVESASDGKSGLELIKNSKPDIVLLDLILPTLDGWEVLRRMRESEDTAHTPIVCFSGIGDRPEVSDKCKELGALDCITKGSMPPDAVIRRIMKLIGKEGVGF